MLRMWIGNTPWGFRKAVLFGIKKTQKRISLIESATPREMMMMMMMMMIDVVRATYDLQR